MASTGEPGRVPALDGIRGLAILLVIVGHIGGPMALGGPVGVTVFFALSGYLITGLLVREVQTSGRIDLRRFYMKRARRLLPALLVVLAAIPLIMWLVGDPRLSFYVPEALSVLFYYRNHFVPDPAAMSWFGHGWSLSVEEQFYLLWPLLMLAVPLLRVQVVRRILIGAALVAAGWRVLTIMGGASYAYSRLDTNAFALLAGAALALAPAAMSRSSRLWAPLGVVTLLGLAAWPVASEAQESYLVLWWGLPSVVAALALLHVARSSGGGLLANPALRWFGGISYGWYLWHQPLMTLQFDGAPSTVWGRVVMAFVSLGIAWLSFRFVEQPVLRWRRSTVSDAVRPARRSAASHPQRV